MKKISHLFVAASKTVYSPTKARLVIRSVMDADR